MHVYTSVYIYIAGSGGGWHGKGFFVPWPQVQIITKPNDDTVAHFERDPNTEFVWPSMIVFSLSFLGGVGPARWDEFGQWGEARLLFVIYQGGHSLGLLTVAKCY